MLQFDSKMKLLRMLLCQKIWVQLLHLILNGQIRSTINKQSKNSLFHSEVNYSLVHVIGCRQIHILHKRCRFNRPLWFASLACRYADA